MQVFNSSKLNGIKPSPWLFSEGGRLDRLDKNQNFDCQATNLECPKPVWAKMVFVPIWWVAGLAPANHPIGPEEHPEALATNAL